MAWLPAVDRAPPPDWNEREVCAGQAIHELPPPFTAGAVPAMLPEVASVKVVVMCGTLPDIKVVLLNKFLTSEAVAARVVVVVGLKTMALVGSGVPAWLSTYSFVAACIASVGSVDRCNTPLIVPPFNCR